MNSNQYKRMSLIVTDDEIVRLNAAWKKSPEHLNRASFIRAAINAYAKEEIFKDDE